MEIEIKRSKPEKEKPKYPYLGVAEDGDLVWFVSPGTGIAIVHDTMEEKTEIDDDWVESLFAPVKKLIVEL